MLAANLPRGEEAFRDEGMSLDLAGQEHGIKHMRTGRLGITKDALLFDDLRFPLPDISGMGLLGKAKIAMTCARQHYEIRFLPARCGRKYFTLYQMLHGSGALMPGSIGLAPKSDGRTFLTLGIIVAYWIMQMPFIFKVKQRKRDL